MFDDLLRAIATMHDDVKALATAQDDEAAAVDELTKLRTEFAAAQAAAEQKVRDAENATLAKRNQLATDHAKVDELLAAVIPKPTSNSNGGNQPPTNTGGTEAE